MAETHPAASDRSAGNPRLTLGQRVYLGKGCLFLGDGSIDIGDDVIIGPDVKIASTEAAAVQIGDGSWIGEAAVIEPGAQIGQGAMVCARTRVSGPVPANSVLNGEPPKVVWYLR